MRFAFALLLLACAVHAVHAECTPLAQQTWTYTLKSSVGDRLVGSASLTLTPNSELLVQFVPSREYTVTHARVDIAQTMASLVPTDFVPRVDSSQLLRLPVVLQNLCCDRVHTQVVVSVFGMAQGPAGERVSFVLSAVPLRNDPAFGTAAILRSVCRV